MSALAYAALGVDHCRCGKLAAPTHAAALAAAALFAASHAQDPEPVSVYPRSVSPECGADDGYHWTRDTRSALPRHQPVALLGLPDPGPPPP